MRPGLTLIFALSVATLATPSCAWAGDPAEADRLVAEGVALGEAGDYPGAIERFAAAEQAFSRPVHDCNIGLAWIGLKKPATAYFFIDRCRQRARATLPDWVEVQHAALRAQLGQSGHVQVRITSTPPGALLAIDTLPGAEPRSPVRLWVPAAPMTVKGRLTGFVVTERTFDAPPGEIALTLRRPVAAAPAAPISAPATMPPKAAPKAPPTVAAAMIEPAPVPDRTLAWTAVGVGVVAAAAGGYFLYAANAEADAAFDASDRRDLQGMNAAKDAARLNEGFGYGALGLAVVATAWGIWSFSTDDAPDVALLPLGLGAGVRVRLP